MKSGRVLMLCFLVTVSAIILGLGLPSVLNAEKDDDQQARFLEKSRSTQSSDQKNDAAEEDWIRSFSRAAKQNADYRPEQTVNSSDQMNHLRYLMLGNADPDFALIVKLVDKAKSGRIYPQSLASYLRWRQKKLGNSYNLENRSRQLILELCIFDIGQTSWRELLQYMNRIRIGSPGFTYSPDTFSFNQIIELIESQIITPREAIDTLIISNHGQNR